MMNYFLLFNLKRFFLIRKARISSNVDIQLQRNFKYDLRLKEILTIESSSSGMFLKHNLFYETAATA